MPVFDLRPLPLLLAGALFFVVPGCGDDHDEHDGHHDDHDPVEEACAHATDTPTEVEAAPDPMESAPGVSAGHTIYRVTLVERSLAAGEFGGFVRYTASEAGEYAIFVSVDVPLTVTTDDGAAVALEVSTPVEACIELERRHDVTLEAGTYFFEFGPTLEPELSLIVESAGDHHDDHAH